MLVIADVHYALEPLRRVVESGETLLILGDLVNLTDYRTGEGAIADVLGIDFAKRSGSTRGSGDYQTMRQLWSEVVGENLEGVRSDIRDAIGAQYERVREVLSGGHGYVIHGNVDRPNMLRDAIPDGFEYVHGESIDIDGINFGFVGGGVATPLGVEGEVSDDEMAELLSGIGEVEILCTHVPPRIESLRTDVVTGRAERGSTPILDYLRDAQPRAHLFGDVHQPQASMWRLGPTICRNVGYFRATGRPFVLDPNGVL